MSMTASVLTVAFDCRMCGHCCEGEGGIILSERDALRLAAGLGVSVPEALAAHAETVGGKNRLRVGPDGFCVFFTQGSGCSIHAFKPDVCRAWPFFKGNLIDDVSWEMIQDYCPGVRSKADGGSFAAFVAEGRAYLVAEGLAHEAADEQAPNALRLDDASAPYGGNDA